MSVFKAFLPRSRSFEMANAWACAHASALTYPRDDLAGLRSDGETKKRKESESEWQGRVSLELFNHGFGHIEFFDELGTQAYLAGNDRMILLAFRGTEIDSLQDICADLRIRQRGGPLAGKVHRGFLSAFDNVWDDRRFFRGIEHAFRDMKAEIQKVAMKQGRRASPALWITGHSLGGALATIAAASFAEIGQIVQSLHTYGCPRVGDREFVRALNEALGGRNYRMVNNSDAVTRLPPRKPFGYDHAGEFFYLTEGGRLEHDPTFWFEFLDVALGWLCDIGKDGLDSIKDHSMSNGADGYIPALSRAMEG